MPDLTLHQIHVLELKAKLSRLEDRRMNGQPAADHIPVDVYLLEDLVKDSEDLQTLLDAHPELRSEVPYA
jgi:hypothetical protein